MYWRAEVSARPTVTPRLFLNAAGWAELAFLVAAIGAGGVMLLHLVVTS